MFLFFNKSKIKSININKIDELLPHIKLIDIRESSETKMGNIKGSKNIPQNNLLKNPEQYLNKEDDYYIICQSGIRSIHTTQILSQLDYKVINVTGGMRSYIGNNIQ